LPLCVVGERNPVWAISTLPGLLAWGFARRETEFFKKAGAWGASGFFGVAEARWGGSAESIFEKEGIAKKTFGLLFL